MNGDTASIESASRESSSASPTATPSHVSATATTTTNGNTTSSRSFRSPFVTPFQVSDNGHKGVCSYCSRIFRGFSASVAGRHLRSVHPTEYEALKNGHTIALNLVESRHGDITPMIKSTLQLDETLLRLPRYCLSDEHVEELRSWMANEKSHNIELIEAVKRHDVLYNRQNPKYKDNFHRQSVWNIIASEVPSFTDGKAANARWKQLRQAYTRNRRRVQDRSRPLSLSNNGNAEEEVANDDLFVEKWTNMRWLEPYLEEGEENAQEKATSSSDQDELDYRRLSSVKPENGMTTFLDGLIENSIEIAQTQRPESRKRKTVTNERNTPPYEIRNNLENGLAADFDDNSFLNRQLLEVMAAQITRASNGNSATSNMTNGVDVTQPTTVCTASPQVPCGEEEAYGRYMAEKMKRLTPQQKFQARMKIENLFYDIEYGEQSST